MSPTMPQRTVHGEKGGKGTDLLHWLVSVLVNP